jgi:hypothetical protein
MKVAVSSSLIVTVLFLLSNIPGIPRVAACELDKATAVCNYLDYSPVDINGTYYYTRTVGLLSAPVGYEADGVTAVEFNNDVLQTSVLCDGQVPQQPGYVAADYIDLVASAEASVGGSFCFGGGIGFAVGYVVSFVAVAVATYCPGQQVAVTLNTVNAAVTTNWTLAKGWPLFKGAVTTSPELCDMYNNCTKFPVLGTGFGRLFITSHGIKLDPENALATVQAPQISSWPVTAKCNADGCVSKGILKTSCPQVSQHGILDFTTLGQPIDFNVAEPAVNTGYFDTQENPIFTEMAQACTRGDGTSFLQTTSDFTCIPSGDIPLIGIQGATTYSDGTQTVPYGPYNGNTIVAEYSMRSGKPAVWTYQAELPPSGDPNVTNTWYQGQAKCTSVGLVVNCWDSAVDLANFSFSWVADEPVNVSGDIYYNGEAGDLCNYTVIDSGSGWIQVVVQSNCIASGCMFNGPVTPGIHYWTVPVFGICYQAQTNGTLGWSFHQEQAIPGTKTGNSTNTYYGTPSCDSSTCDCDPWNCGGELLCLMATSWSACKCSLIINPSQDGSEACKVEVTLARVALYIALALVAILILFGIIKAILKTRRTSSYRS